LKKTSGIQQKKRKFDEESLAKFQEKVKAGHEGKKVVQDIVKIVLQVCPQLDEQNNVSNNPLLGHFTPYLPLEKKSCPICGKALDITPQQLHKVYLCKSCGFTQQLPEGETGVTIWEYLYQLSVKEQTDNLRDFLVYLREKHCYCYYCGSRYDSQEQLEEMCPGILEEDH